MWKEERVFKGRRSWGWDEKVVVVKGAKEVMRGSAQLEFRRREMETVVVGLKEKDEFSLLTATRKGGKIEFLLGSREERGSIFGGQLQSKRLHRLKRVGEGR